MPTIPILGQNQVQAAPLPTVRREYLRDTRAESLGNALGNVGAVVSKVQEEERNKADTAAVTEAHARLNSWVNEALYTAPDAALKKHGKDAFDLASQVMPKYQERVNEINNELTSPRQKRAFSQASLEFRSQMERQLGSHELASREQFYDETDKASRAMTAERAAFNYTDPQIVEQSKRDTLATVANEAKRKGWDETTIADQSFKAMDDLHKSLLDSMLSRGDTSSATKYLNENLPQMSSGAAESFQRQLLSADAQQNQALNNAKRILGDAATKNGDKLLSEGRMTPKWIEDNREVLSPEDYRYFYKALNGGEAPRNPMIYASLRERAGLGADVRVEARSALQYGQIDLAGYDRIVNNIENERPGWYKNGVQHLSTMSGYSDLNPTPGAAQLKSAMLDEWQEWADAHKDANPDVARKMYKSISDSHMLADKAVKVLTLPAPKFMVGSRDNIDIAASEASTVRALQEGRITKDEFDRQAKILKDWRDLYTEKPSDRP